MLAAYDLSPKTILVVNSSVPQSLTDALDYCARRSVPVANIRAFNFGTTDYPAGVNLVGARSSASPFWVGQSATVSCQNGNAALYGPSGTNPQPGFYNAALTGAVLPTLANEITNNGALAVVLSTFTPTWIPYPTGNWHPFAAVCGAAVYHNSSGLSTYAPPSAFLTTSPAASLQALGDLSVPSDWASRTTLRPHGRLGCPDFQFGTFAEVTPKSGTSVYANAVQAAKSTESVNNWAKPIWYSSTMNNALAGGLPASAAYAAFIAAAGFSTVVDIGDGVSAGIAYSITTQNLSTPTSPLWSALTLNSFNNGIMGSPSLWATNTKIKANIDAGMLAVQAGAFAMAWFSYSFNFGVPLLYAGAVAAVMSVGEPLSASLPFGHDVFETIARQGISLALASFWSPTSGGASVAGYTVFGDPLYAPFAAYNLTTRNAMRATIDGTTSIDSVTLTTDASTSGVIAAIERTSVVGASDRYLAHQDPSRRISTSDLSIRRM